MPWQLGGKPQQSQRLSSRGLCASPLCQEPPAPDSTRSSEPAECLVPPTPLFLLGLALFPEPLWIPWRPQKAGKCGRSMALRGRAVEEKGFFLPLLSKQKEGPPSSEARIAFAKLYWELRKGERTPAGSENWKAIQNKQCSLLPLSLPLLPPDGRRSPGTPAPSPSGPGKPAAESGSPAMLSLPDRTAAPSGRVSLPPPP